MIQTIVINDIVPNEYVISYQGSKAQSITLWYLKPKPMCSISSGILNTKIQIHPSEVSQIGLNMSI